MQVSNPLGSLTGVGSLSSAFKSRFSLFASALHCALQLSSLLPNALSVVADSVDEDSYYPHHFRDATNSSRAGRTNQGTQKESGIQSRKFRGSLRTTPHADEHSGEGQAQPLLGNAASSCRWPGHISQRLIEGRRRSAPEATQTLIRDVEDRNEAMRTVTPYLPSSSPALIAAKS